MQKPAVFMLRSAIDVEIAGKRRWIALAAIPFVMNAIILTQSRDAFIGVLAARFSGLVPGAAGEPPDSLCRRALGPFTFPPPRQRSILAAHGYNQSHWDGRNTRGKRQIENRSCQSKLADVRRPSHGSRISWKSVFESAIYCC